MTTDRKSQVATKGKGSHELNWKDISDRNPLTFEEVAELAKSIALNISDETAAGVLLLCHALTFEPSRVEREGILQKVKEATAWLFPAFDAMVREEIKDRLATLREQMSDVEGGGAQ